MKKIIYILILSLITTYSCDDLSGDLDIENFNDAEYNDVLSNPDDLERILAGAYTDAMNVHVSSFSVSFLLQADQLTTTNNSRDWWQFAFQPRKQFVNSPSSRGISTAERFWTYSYSAIKGANHIIRWIEGENKPYIVNDVDKSEEALASAYFIKGFSEGNIATIYDRGYIVNWDSTDAQLKEQHTREEMLAKALEDINKGISLTEAASSSFSTNYLVNTPLNKSKFIELMNSFAARMLISFPATKQEALNTDFNQVLAYANKGLSSDFYVKTRVPYVWYSYVARSVARYLTAWGNAAPVQTDLKVIHLMDPNYPKEYPDTGILPPATSSDPRLDDYFAYTESFGYLNADRDRTLFSNYRSSRWNNEANDIGNDPDFDNPIFLKAELDYIKAEATLKTAGPAAAASILNNSVRKTIGGITTGNTYPEVMKALHYEYAVELQLSGSGIIQWSFMKRNDLLRKGSMTLIPIAASELESLGISESYTFGGLQNVGKLGTASTDGWLDENSYNQ